jgi:hypothetical protein
MRKRLLLAVTVGAVGLAIGYALADRFGITSTQAMIFGGAAGAFAGYLIGIMMDVFLASPSETE